MEIIVPCAGLSTRFPGLRPKYLLVDYSGKLMIENSIKNFIGKNKITISILKQHDIAFKAKEKLVKVFEDKVNIVTIENETNGPADTVYQTILKSNFNTNSELLIKDCDSFYDFDYEEGNIVYASKLSENTNLKNVAAKSYVVTNEKDEILSIYEKQIVSDYFSVGGYKFNKMDNFLNTFNLIHKKNEIYISDVISKMIENKHSFKKGVVKNYIDVGTSQEWLEYNNKPTYFCDIDGTIIKTKDFHDDPHEIIPGNVKTLLKEQARGCKIVFTTARDVKYENYTRKILNKIGFVNYTLVMQVNHSRRVLVNDYANSNPYPSAIAINIKRDSDCLEDLIGLPIPTS
jgi:hypothetical protein